MEMFDRPKSAGKRFKAQPEQKSKEVRQNLKIVIVS